MPAEVQSPLRVYLEHLERGELAYQFSLAAGRPVFFPGCCVHSRAATGWNGGSAQGSGPFTLRPFVHPPEGAPYNVALIDCDEGFRMMSRVEEVAPGKVRFGVHRP